MEINCVKFMLFVVVVCVHCVLDVYASNDTISESESLNTTALPTTTIVVNTKVEYYVLAANDKDFTASTSENVETVSDISEGKKRNDKKSSSNTQIYIIAVIGVAPAAMAGLMWWLKGIKRKCIRDKAKNSKRNKRTEENIPNPFLINDNSIDQITYKLVQRAERLNDSSALWYNAYRPSFVKSRRVYSHEVPRKNLDMIEVLGEGNFGQVWKAKAVNLGDNKEMIVAVKTNKINTNEAEAEELLKELDIMLQLGTHPNVVTLLGCCTENEPFYLIMEYVSNGKLLTYLRNHRADHSYYNDIYNHNNNNNGKTESHHKFISSADLILFMYQISKGMEFISSHGIIHRDLAVRNVLINENKTCKVADFGLSRSIRDKESDSYEQKTGGAMPIRWMSPESLSMGLFSMKSDVWSFGILIWEIVTLGSTPYIGMGAQEVLKYVTDGHVMSKPSHCSEDMYCLMRECWAHCCQQRLTFTELRIKLSKLIELSRGYVDLDHFPDNLYYNLYASPGEKV